MTGYTIVKMGLSEFNVYKERKKVSSHSSREDAILAIFELSGWTGDYIIRFCDDYDIFMYGQS